MKKNEVILLYKDGTAKRKHESSLSLEDFRYSKYLLIDTSVMKNEPSRNFVIIDSTEYLHFTKAIIDYQLFVSGWDSDVESIETLKPIHVETSSLSNVITLINCIDRIGCLNELMLEQETCGEGLRIHMQFFQVTLYDGDRKIYDRFYSYDEKSKKKNSRYITRIFYRIYETPIEQMIRNDEFLILSNDNTWRIGSNGDYQMLGIPLKYSNTITLCRKDELYRLCSYTDINITFTVHEESIQTKELLDKSFRKGDYDNVEGVAETIDYFMICYNSFKLENRDKFVHLEIMSNLRFFITMMNVIYDEVYSNEESDKKMDYVNDNFDSIISINFYKEMDIEPRTIYINESSLITTNDFLAII